MIRKLNSRRHRSRGKVYKKRDYARFMKDKKPESPKQLQEKRAMRPLYRKDRNHDLIAAVFKLSGYSVADTAQVGNGFPDMVVSKNNRTTLIEVKSDVGALTPHQERFHENWKGELHVVRTVNQARDIISIHDAHSTSVNSEVKV